MNLPLTPVRRLYRGVDPGARREGIVSGAARYTYAEFGERCERLAAGLPSKGVGRGDRGAFLSLNNNRLQEGYLPPAGRGTGGYWPFWERAWASSSGGCVSNAGRATHAGCRGRRSVLAPSSGVSMRKLWAGAGAAPLSGWIINVLGAPGVLRGTRA